MAEFTFHLPGLTVNGTYEPADATPQQVLAVFTADFLASEHEAGVDYEVDSFVRMTYSLAPVALKAEHPAHTATKHTTAHKK